MVGYKLNMGKLKSPRVAVAAAVIFSMTVGSGWLWSTRANAYAVLLDGRQVAVVENRQEAEQVLQQLVEEKAASTGREVRYRGELSFRPIRAEQGEPSTPVVLREVLADKLEFVSDATGIAVNGEVKLVVADETTGRQVIEQLKEKFRPEIEGIILDKLDLEEEVTLVSREAALTEIKGADAAVETLLNGTTRVEKYTVKSGDSLWAIAKNQNMQVQGLLDANPQLTSDKLSIGQELNLVKPDPQVHVAVSYRRTITEYIPYPIKVKNDANLWRGQQRVEQKGREGQKEVQYRVVERNGIRLSKDILSEKVLAEPVTQVVARGSKVMVASRGGGGSGQLSWPLRGAITSPFGYRKSPYSKKTEFHTGLDIDGVTGDPVFAAESGVVTFVGTKGNYGKRIVIDHGDGLETAYNHLSGYKVSVGDKVSRSQLIGLVGNTGRSTGSHLDFEVKVNGEFRNPLDFLNR
ncbi:hypothetical protein SY88_14455 [Clostridiales bacterium PH28_bin88]|nr:hypothetical protein SY88_14455 [Clostridiales bacterium PH28_bin88]